ncbi:MAG: response regulator [Nitrospirota bacterium]|jgi:DNA-binding NtrC family response regulator
MKVLVVDDEQLVRWFLERALKKWGHDVTSVSTADDARSLLGKEDFDVLFTDLRMPEGNGAHLVHEVSENPELDIKVVVCSAFVTVEMAQGFRKRGILTLKKPFKLAELERTLELCSN